jgi:transcriptional regulator with XRE-family HTH domain
MRKSIHREENRLLAELLLELRREEGLTQVELAQRLGNAQSFVSDVESGSRRLDLVQLLDYCSALDATLTSMVKRFEVQIRARVPKEPRQR